MNRFAVYAWTLLLCLAGSLSLTAQSPAPGGQTAPAQSGGQLTATTTPAAAVPSQTAVQVASGENVELELKDELNTRRTRKGDLAEFRTTDEVWSNGRVAVPRGTKVRATVSESKRPGRMHGKAEMRFEFKELVLPDGTSLPLSADLMRAGDFGPPGKQTVQGEHGKGHDATTLARNAGTGAVLGAILSRSAGGAVSGAAAGAAVTAVGMMVRRGPDLDLPPGMRFEIALTKPLNIPVAATEPARTAALAPPGSAQPETAPLALHRQPITSQPETAAAAGPGPLPKAVSETPSVPATVAANRTSPPAPATTAPPAAAQPPMAGNPPGGYTMKVNVNLVQVDVTVRDARGRIVDGLMRDDFRIFEDGTQQQILQFSRDELPLAVALVIDRSGSVAPFMGQIRDAALDTLSQLKTEDQVALFAFAAKVERLQDLTDDRERIGDAISRIQAGGGTNIADALDEAALYLGRAAKGKRHAIILISDNQGTVRGYASDSQVIRSALETETVIYSIRIAGGEQMPMALRLPLWSPSVGSVKKMTHETGGEIIDTREVGSIESAMAEVIRRLKMRYTLGYESSNQRRDGSFRKIEVRVADKSPKGDAKYFVYARHGYYAPLDRTAAASGTKQR